MVVNRQDDLRAASPCFPHRSGREQRQDVVEVDDVRRLSSKDLTQKSCARRSVREGQAQPHALEQRGVVGAGNFEPPHLDARLGQPLLEQVDVTLLSTSSAIAVVDEKHAHRRGRVRGWEARPHEGRQSCALRAPTVHRVVDVPERDHDISWPSFFRVLDMIDDEVTTELRLGQDSGRGVVLTFDDGSTDHAGSDGRWRRGTGRGSSSSRPACSGQRVS